MDTRAFVNRISVFDARARDIRGANLPAWYELRAADGDLLIRVHVEAFRFLRERLRIETQSGRSVVPPLVLRLEQELRLPPFIPPTEREWGFGKVVYTKQDDDNNDWVILGCPLPVVEAERADDADGWDGAYALSATLKLIFLILSNLFEKRVDSKSPQLLLIEGLSTKDEPNGFGFTVTLSLSAGGWVHLQEGKRYEIGGDMQSAWRDMMGRRYRHEAPRCQVEFRPSEGVIFTCPGAGTALVSELDPEDENELMRGFRLVTREVSSPIQQLALLYGVASLHELMRREAPVFKIEKAK